jgi:hypothetical protein
MKKVIYFFSLFNQGFIKNDNLPICKKCKYFFMNDKSSNIDLGRCSKFGIKDLISGEIQYEYASLSRISNTRCGKKGKYFEE